MVSPLKFGTSGLRGLVSNFEGPLPQTYIIAFLEMLQERGLINPGCFVYVGQDLRPSSPKIARCAWEAIALAGFQPIDCGPIATPALAFYSMKHSSPAIMITGSHIDIDRNGLKFYCPDREINKIDEIEILQRQETIDYSFFSSPCASPHKKSLLAYYSERYSSFFYPNSLSGLNIGVYQHSSVLRDFLVTILQQLGAHVTPIGRSDCFIPIDTESISLLHRKQIEQWCCNHGWDALVSSDADGDRAFLADEKGHILKGDAIGVLAALYLSADAFVTPLTSNSILKKQAFGAEIITTRIGSPYVIEAMSQEKLREKQCVVGFEANGGFILGSQALHSGRKISSLPTRDATLALLCCLSTMVEQKKPLSFLVEQLAFKPSASCSVTFDYEKIIKNFLKKLETSSFIVKKITSMIGSLESITKEDGIRFSSFNGNILHFRMSNNSPKIRCYVESKTKAETDALLEWSVSFIKDLCFNKNNCR